MENSKFCHSKRDDVNSKRLFLHFQVKVNDDLGNLLEHQSSLQSKMASLYTMLCVNNFVFDLHPLPTADT